MGIRGAAEANEAVFQNPRERPSPGISLPAAAVRTSVEAAEAALRSGESVLSLPSRSWGRHAPNYLSASYSGRVARGRRARGPGGGGGVGACCSGGGVFGDQLREFAPSRGGLRALGRRGRARRGCCGLAGTEFPGSWGRGPHRVVTALPSGGCGFGAAATRRVPPPPQPAAAFAFPYYAEVTPVREESLGCWQPDPLRSEGRVQRASKEHAPASQWRSGDRGAVSANNPETELA